MSQVSFKWRYHNINIFTQQVHLLSLWTCHVFTVTHENENIWETLFDYIQIKKQTKKVHELLDRFTLCPDVKLIMPTLLILLFTIFIMVTVIPYAFSSVIKQLKAVRALEAAGGYFVFTRALQFLLQYLSKGCLVIQKWIKSAKFSLTLYHLTQLLNVAGNWIKLLCVYVDWCR